MAMKETELVPELRRVLRCEAGAIQSLTETLDPAAMTAAVKAIAGCREHARRHRRI